MAEARDAGDPYGAGRPPSHWVGRFIGLVTPGAEILDVAAGGGRHSRLAADRGHAVVAVDRDRAAVGALDDIPGVAAVEADLEDGSPWPLAERRFGGVIVCNYLHRPVLPDIVASVAPGGILIYETFARGNERFGRPRNPDFLLAPGELLDAVAGRLSVVAYECGIEAAPSPRVVQRICAVAPPRQAIDCAI